MKGFFAATSTTERAALVDQPCALPRVPQIGGGTCLARFQLALMLALRAQQVATPGRPTTGCLYPIGKAIHRRAHEVEDGRIPPPRRASEAMRP